MENYNTTFVKSHIPYRNYIGMDLITDDKLTRTAGFYTALIESIDDIVLNNTREIVDYLKEQPYYKGLFKKMVNSIDTELTRKKVAFNTVYVDYRYAVADINEAVLELSQDAILQYNRAAINYFNSLGHKDANLGAKIYLSLNLLNFVKKIYGDFRATIKNATVNRGNKSIAECLNKSFPLVDVDGLYKKLLKIDDMMMNFYTNTHNEKFRKPYEMATDILYKTFLSQKFFDAVSEMLFAESPKDSEVEKNFQK